MPNRIADISLRQAALVAGIGYLFIFIVNSVANAFIGLGDAATTASYIMASESLFRLGLACWVILLVADVVVAWALYVFLKPVSKSLSLLTAWFRLVFTAIIGITLLNLFSGMQLLSGADYLTAFEPDQLHAQALLFLNAYAFGFNIGFVFFGIHILGLGYLIFKSGYVPRILGVFLMIAFVGYQIDSFASVLSSNYASNEVLFFVFVAIPAVIAELSLTLWLLIKGTKVEQQDNHAPAAP